MCLLSFELLIVGIIRQAADQKQGSGGNFCPAKIACRKLRGLVTILQGKIVARPCILEIA
jgi:hypothetical protein